ncbi:DUF3043 domain-containing protein [Lacisediminihabitans profunda]|uniref:DUF3043 domain-containing protein n=1 Tax=Lacisediminihabitans profunda TaxID=2594790 RepID=A0A5C8USW4_9MICO|nr:DUF3043 domain-containing protein [Lacisediminihabitans profunda]TXN30701.1 DUF3043 domain-containing protein [Lacisediminihabitans profunda]
MAKPSTSKPDDAVGYELNTDSTMAGKGHATPTRKEREAANLRPLVSSDRKAGNAAARARAAEAREKARIGMANGDEKYLPVRDKGVQRRFIRDYVDARWSVGELIIPVMFLVIILTFINNVLLQNIAIFSLWGFFLVAVIDCVVVGMIVQRKLAAKVGADRLQKGNRWYTAMRALQLRPMRLPKPQVKRGQFPA